MSVQPADAPRLVSAAEIQRASRRWPREIARDSPDDDLHLICVLKGAFLFLSDLVRAIDGP